MAALLLLCVQCTGVEPRSEGGAVLGFLPPCWPLGQRCSAAECIVRARTPGRPPRAEQARREASVRLGRGRRHLWPGMSEGLGAGVDGRSATHFPPRLSAPLSPSRRTALAGPSRSSHCRPDSIPARRFPRGQVLGERGMLTTEACPGPVERTVAVPWTHFLQLSALRTVIEQSPVEAKLSQWRAGSLAAGALANSWGFTNQDVARREKARDLLTGMKWERVLAAEIDIGLKLSLWKSQARARRQREEWNVENAVLSLDFERSTAGAFAPGVAGDGPRAPPPPAPVRAQNNMVPGRSAALQGARRGEQRRQRGDVDMASYTREIARTLEHHALATGKRLLSKMERRNHVPSTIFFNALLAACTGKGVPKGVGTDGIARTRGSRPSLHSSVSTPTAGADGAAFKVRARASTSASRASSAAARPASLRWRECSEVLRLMKGHGVDPDSATLNILVDACVKQVHTLVLAYAGATSARL